MADLVIKVGANSKEYQDELDKVAEASKELEKQFEKVAKVATAAFAVVGASIAYAVNEFAEAQKISLQTNAVLKATGQVAGISSSQVNSLANSLQAVTEFSDETIKQGENILLTFTKIGEETFPRATEAALDLATRMGSDASSAAQVLGKALESPTEGLNQLRRSGINFTEQQKQQIAQFEATNNIAAAQKVILDQVNASIGGLAKESAKGISGSLSQLKNIFSDIGESVGEKFAPSVQEGINKLKLFLTAIKENETALKVISGTLAVAFVGSGALAAIASISLAMSALAPAIAAASAALAAFATGPLVPIIAAAAALGVIVNAGKQLYQESQRKQSGRAEGLVDSKRVDDEIFTQERITAENKRAQKERAANEAEARRKEREEKLFALNTQVLDLQGYSEEYLSLLKQYRDNELALSIETDQLKKEMRLALREEIAQELQEAYESDTQSKIEFEENLALMEEQYNLQKVDRQSKLYQDLQKEAEKSYLTENKMKANFIKQQLSEDQKSKQQRYNDEVKYGQTYAVLNQAMHSEIYRGTQTAFGEMEKLTKSKNETLRSIGKAAAIANIVMSTAQSAMLVYQGWAAIPFVGQALGIAAAAAAIAFGAEQLATVTGLAEGGIAMGGIPGVDSIPAMLTPGELVVPTQNFDEVVTAVADSRNGTNLNAGERGTDTEVRVQIELVGDASQILTAKQIEDRSLGLSRET